MPISLALREHLPWLLDQERPDVSKFASGASQDVLKALQARGALFFQELKAITGLLPSQLEEALRELAALGLVSSDTFTAVRAIDARSTETQARLRRFTKMKVHRPTSPIGRWSLFPGASEPTDRQAVLDHWCRLLLARYGVLFRDLLAREPSAPPWWELARVLRRMELRGEVRPCRRRAIRGRIGGGAAARLARCRGFPRMVPDFRRRPAELIGRDWRRAPDTRDAQKRPRFAKRPLRRRQDRGAD
jgi:ATP-dependent Lhr-like helicase